MANLAAALDPRSIAVIGASENPDKIGGRPLLYLSQFGFRGEVIPVNPRREEVQGLRTVPRLSDLPGRRTSPSWRSRARQRSPPSTNAAPWASRSPS